VQGPSTADGHHSARASCGHVRIFDEAFQIFQSKKETGNPGFKISTYFPKVGKLIQNASLSQTRHTLKSVGSQM